MATALRVPLDVFSVRKLGVPGHPELAMGAIASGGVQVLNEDVLAWYRPSADIVDARGPRRDAPSSIGASGCTAEGRPLVLVEGRTVILVDDGLATGSTMRAAVQAVRQLRAGRVVVAAPVGAPDTCEAHAARGRRRRVRAHARPLRRGRRVVPGFQRDDATTRCGACFRTRRRSRPVDAARRHFSAAHLPPGQRLFSSQTYSKSPSLSHSGLARISNSCSTAA